MKHFIIILFIALGLLSCNKVEERPLKFAIISDLHQDIMHDAPERLQTFLDAAADQQVDFIIELGDFCFPKEENSDFLNIWDAHNGEKYHVLGNHDMDISSKEKYMSFVGMPNRYYSFDKGNFHFIILDANHIYEDGNYVPYNSGNYYIESSKIDFIDQQQIEWLRNELATTDKPCILFSHQSLENTVQNRDLIREILEEENRQAGWKKVLVAFSGHDHTDYAKEINGITYIQINSASYQWVGGDYASAERFSEEVNARRPALKYTVPYKDALYAIVTLENNKMEIIGQKTVFVPPTPEDLGIPADVYAFPLVPQISNFTLKY